MYIPVERNDLLLVMLPEVKKKKKKCIGIFVVVVVNCPHRESVSKY